MPCWPDGSQRQILLTPCNPRSLLLKQGFAAAESIPLCKRVDAAAVCRAQHHGRREGNLWLCSSDSVPGRTHYSSTGWELAGTDLEGCRCSPTPCGGQAKLLHLGERGPRAQFLPWEDKATPCTPGTETGSAPTAAGTAHLEHGHAPPPLSCSSPDLQLSPAAPTTQHPPTVSQEGTGQRWAARGHSTPRGSNNDTDTSALQILKPQVWLQDGTRCHSQTTSPLPCNSARLGLSQPYCPSHSVVNSKQSWQRGDLGVCLSQEPPRSLNAPSPVLCPGLSACTLLCAAPPVLCRGLGASRSSAQTLGIAGPRCSQRVLMGSSRMP